MSLLKEFLSSVGRHDVLQEFERVELCISLGCILKDYINGLRQGTTCADMKCADSYTNIVEFLLTIREGNQELISPLLEQFMQVNNAGEALQILDGVILDSQLSWPMVIQRIQVECLTATVVAFVVTVELIALRGKMADVARRECQRSAWENHNVLFPRQNVVISA